MPPFPPPSASPPPSPPSGATTGSLFSCCSTNKQRGRERQTDRRIDGQTDRRTGRQRDRQTGSRVGACETRRKQTKRTDTGELLEGKMTTQCSGWLGLCLRCVAFVQDEQISPLSLVLTLPLLNCCKSKQPSLEKAVHVVGMFTNESLSTANKMQDIYSRSR